MPSIRFSPTANLLVWTDVDGSLARWFGPIPSTHTHPAKQPSSIASKMSNTRIVSHQDQKRLNGIFDGVGEDLGADDEDFKDKMAIDHEDADMYDDGWVIDDDDELGNAARFRTGPNVAIDRDETGPREMGKCVTSGIYLALTYLLDNSSQCHESPTRLSARFHPIPEQEKISR
jgi:hypothetical protein